MAELFASGRIVDVVLVLMLLEGIALTIWYKRFGQGPRPVDLWVNLFAGAALFLALRSALVGAAWAWTGLWLFLGLLAHLLDLSRRWQR